MSYSGPPPSIGYISKNYPAKKTTKPRVKKVSVPATVDPNPGDCLHIVEIKVEKDRPPRGYGKPGACVACKRVAKIGHVIIYIYGKDFFHLECLRQQTESAPDLTTAKETMIALLKSLIEKADEDIEEPDDDED